MRERGMRFKAPEVRALLDGSKTQDRRIVKKLHHECVRMIPHDQVAGAFWAYDAMDRPLQLIPCPYGQPGDRLFVRESGWERPGRTASMMLDDADTWPIYEYDADGINSEEVESLKMWEWKRRPSIHMPRWASRITLEIVSARVERLQDISEDDSIAEGITRSAGGMWSGAPLQAGTTPQAAYAVLWHTINGAGSWDANPFVWVVEFKRILGGEGKS